MIWAYDENHARGQAADWLFSRGYTRDNIGVWRYPIRDGDRFAYLDME